MAFTNNVKCAQLADSIADCLKNEMAERVVKSWYLAVMFDSNTNCSVQETEAVNVQYGRNGHSVNELLALASLKHMQVALDEWRRIREDGLYLNVYCVF